MTEPSDNDYRLHFRVLPEDEDDGDCFQCGGEGYIYGCSWDWQCDTYDAGEGTCLCTRRCDVCNPNGEA
jgi:hypothetical protein